MARPMKKGGSNSFSVSISDETMQRVEDEMKAFKISRSKAVENLISATAFVGVDDEYKHHSFQRQRIFMMVKLYNWEMCPRCFKSITKPRTYWLSKSGIIGTCHNASCTGIDSDIRLSDIGLQFDRHDDSDKKYSYAVLKPREDLEIFFKHPNFELLFSRGSVCWDDKKVIL